MVLVYVDEWNPADAFVLVLRTTAHLPFPASTTRVLGRRVFGRDTKLMWHMVEAHKYGDPGTLVAEDPSKNDDQEGIPNAAIWFAPDKE